MKQVTKAYMPRKKFFAQPSRKLLALNSIDLGIEGGRDFRAGGTERER